MVFSPFADLSDTIHLGTMSFPTTAAHTLLFTWLKKKKKKNLLHFRKLLQKVSFLIQARMLLSSSLSHFPNENVGVG